MFKQISMDDARPYASRHLPDTDRELLFLDNFKGVDFTNKTLQLGFMIVCYCEKGFATAKINGRHIRLEPGKMLVAFGEQVVEDCRPSEDFAGNIALISQDYSLESFVGLRHLWPYLLYIFRNPVLTLDPDEKAFLFESFRMVARRLKKPAHRYHRDCIVSLLRVFCLDVCNLLGNRYQEEQSVPSRSYTIFDDFITLAQQNIREHRDVKWYSSQLCLTSKYLSEAVKKVSGKTAGQWISILVMNEIKLLLRNTTLSVKEIAQELNFPNQSFLGKYFKNATGISPNSYRNN